MYLCSGQRDRLMIPNEVRLKCVSRPPRALVVVSQVYADGGIQRFNRIFLTACHELGIQCEVLSLGDDDASRGRWDPPRSASVNVFGRNKAHFAARIWARMLARQYDFIVVGHVNCIEVVAAAVIFRLRRRPRVLMIAHGIDVWTGLDGWRMKRAMAKLDLILCVSRYTRQRIQIQRPELPEERCAIFPNALSDSWLSKSGALQPIVSAMRIPERFILSVTRLDRGDRYKGLTTVIEAVAMLEDSSVHCVVAGQGNDQAFLEGMAQRFGVSDRVHFIGRVSDAQLARLYEDCIAFVLPSGKEGFGIVFLEAMYFGAPIIAAREKGAIDVVQQGETGLLVPYGDTISLAEAIGVLLGNEALRAYLRENGRRLVSEDGPFSSRAYRERLGKLLNIDPPTRPFDTRVS